MESMRESVLRAGHHSLCSAAAQDGVVWAPQPFAQPWAVTAVLMGGLFRNVLWRTCLPHSCSKLAGALSIIIEKEEIPVLVGSGENKAE